MLEKKNILLKIEYDGTGYHGWQRQPGQSTVQGEIEKALNFLLKEDVSINGTSRTDAGVHALMQCASFESYCRIPPDNLKRAMNNILPDSIRILQAVEKDKDFHARFSSKGKNYIYKLRIGPYNLFKRNYCYHVGDYLDCQAMALAAKFLVGTYDFAAFQAAGGTPRQTTVRTIKEAYISKDDKNPEEIIISIRGDGFLYNMVRIIAGSLVEVGLNKMEACRMKDIIDSKDRSQAGHTAPPQGLYLKEIYYE